MEERLTGSGRHAYGVGVTAGRDGGRAAIVSARLLAALAVVLACTAVALPLLSGYGYLDELTATPEVVVAVSFSLTGALLVGSEAARRIGWLLLAIGLTSALYTSSVSKNPEMPSKPKPAPVSSTPFSCSASGSTKRMRRTSWRASANRPRPCA